MKSLSLGLSCSLLALALTTPTALVWADDAPATQPEVEKRLTPGELMRQMREEREARALQPLVAQIDMSQPILEKPAGFSLFGSGGVDLRSLLARLDAAAQDDNCRAVLLTFYSGGMTNFAQAQEIRTKLVELEKAGKRTFVYADTYDTMSYFVASAATDIVLMDGGELFMPGVAFESMFYKGTLDLLGVTPDYIQIGEYKGAEEPYTRTEPSPELTEEMNGLVNALYGQIVTQISNDRSLPKREVRRVIDRAMLPAQDALDAGFVDHLADADGLRVLFEEQLGGEAIIDSSYAMSEEEESFDPDNPFAIFQALAPKSVEATEPSIALVYAEGVITGGEGGGGGLFGTESGIGSEAIRRSMRIIERDDNIKAVVIRIDSPGGSALASEAMYQAVRRVAEKKPVIISIGGMAASGGYYLAVAGDTIYADPAAIVGSIGVVGGKLVLDGLYEKVGLNTVIFSKGRNAGLFSDSTPWDDRQKQLVRNWMKSTYDQFTDRVMSTREGKIMDIDEVARGRIFLAKDAMKLGMVDHMGGIEAAMADAAEQGGLDDDYGVVILPDSSPDPFAGMGLPFGQSPLGEALQLLPHSARNAVIHAMTTAQLLDERPVILLTPWRVRFE